MLRFKAIRSGLLSLTLAGFTFAGAVSAQTKIAIINVQDAILKSDEIKKSAADLEAKYKPRQTELQKLQADLQSIEQQLSGGKLSQQAAAELQASGQRKQRDLQSKSQDLQTDVDADRNEILGKAGAKMRAVVEKLAAEKGYDVVVDVSQTVYFKPALDITNDALAAYNKANPAK